jgi:hypothetical protein
MKGPHVRIVSHNSGVPVIYLCWSEDSYTAVNVRAEFGQGCTFPWPKVPMRALSPTRLAAPRIGGIFMS